MQTISTSLRVRGFLIIETLVALLVLSLGVLGMTTLMGQVTGGTGESKARSEALALAREKLDDLRNNGIQAEFTGRLASGSDSPTNADGMQFKREWRVNFNPYNPVPASSPLLVSKVEVDVKWTGRSGQEQTVRLDSAIAWNDPVRGVMAAAGTGGNVIRPTGNAIRGTANYKPGMAYEVFTDSENITRLRLASGAKETILYLRPNAAGQALSFTTIHGKVYFDAQATNLPAPKDVNLRLSSEGQCVYINDIDPATNSLPTSGSAKYRYFDYTCFVGPGWYGNVGVQLPDSGSPPTVCVGDPSVADASKTTNPAWTESTIRTYRGFRKDTINDVPVFISTGMAESVSPLKYAYGNGGTGTTRGGYPWPSKLTDFYTSIPTGQDYFKQDFLISRISGSQTCAQRMTLIAGTFTYNAGKNLCISPDNWSTSSDECPDIWPNASAGACSIQISGSFNPPKNASQATTTISYTTSTGGSGICQGQGNSANYTCSLTGGASTNVTIKAIITGKVSGSQATQTCTVTRTNVGCSSISGVNIDSSTSDPACTQTP
ncbi:hypothetical protein ACT80S_12490 [Ramlibacter sp. MAHUQ-53]|uniref:hypothetical protein n=1 Tax=unclassified Ramlibacter TaxID=2617605 RepID=UPI00362DE7C4